LRASPGVASQASVTSLIWASVRNDVFVRPAVGTRPQIRETRGADQFGHAYAAGLRLSRREAAAYARDTRTASAHAS